MDSPIEIKVNSKVIEDLILKSIERCLPENDLEDKLQMLTAEQVAVRINSTRQHVLELKDIGILKSIKTGKSFMFSRKEIEKFEDDYAGLDVSNRLKAREAYKYVNGI